MANTGMSFWHASTKIVLQWLHTEGRFFPVSFYQGYGQFALVHSVEVYKAMLILWTLVSSACVWWLMRELGMNRAQAALVIVVAVTTFQFRPNDSIMAYAGLTQSVLISTAISLAFFHRWLVRKRHGYLAGSLVLFLVANLTYESGYLYLPLFALLAWRERRNFVAAARALAPVAALSTAIIIGALILRAHASSGPNGPYQPKFIPKEIIFTFFDQFVGAVPLTLAYFDPLNTYHPRSQVLLGAIGSTDILIGLCFAVITIVLLSARGVTTSRPGQLAFFGLCLWLLSALPIALANRYHSEIVAGGAHLPVYIESFAFAIFVVAAAEALAKLSGKRLERLRLAGIPLLIIFLGVAVGSVAAVAHRANAIVAQGLKYGKDGRAIIEDAGAAGLFDLVPTDAKFYVDPSNLSNSAALYRMVAGRRFDLQPGTPELVKSVPHSRAKCADGWWTRDVYIDPGRGFITLSCFGIGPVRLFLWGIDPKRTQVSWTVRIEGRPKKLSGRASSVLRGLQLKSPRGFVDPYSISVQVPPPSK